MRNENGIKSGERERGKEEVEDEMEEDETFYFAIWSINVNINSISKFKS